MEMPEGLSKHKHQQAIAERRKKQTEIENKKRQLEDDRRQLQHLKSKALRERWLLDGQPSADAKQEVTINQLEQNEDKALELTGEIFRLEQQMDREMELGVSDPSTQVCSVEAPQKDKDSIGHNNNVSATYVTEVKVANNLLLDNSESLSDKTMKEDKVLKSLHLENSRGCSDVTMKTAMYSVEITVERDNVTGETKVLSTNTLLPVDLSHQGVKVYEDDQKVVHKMSGENGVQKLSATEVDELIQQADRASTMCLSTDTCMEVSNIEFQEEASSELQVSPVKEIKGLKTKAATSPVQGLPEASSNSPVTMVFMGYQNVEDQVETNKVLGLEGPVKAEFVVIEEVTLAAAAIVGNPKEAQEAHLDHPVITSVSLEAAPDNSEKGETRGNTSQLDKKPQPCKCCLIM